MSLILFTLPNGAELIGDQTDSDFTTLTIEHPLVIRPIEQAPGKFALDLFPHSLANPEGKHKFSRTQMISVAVDIPEMLEKAYITRTSNIVIAQTLNQWEGKLN